MYDYPRGAGGSDLENRYTSISENDERFKFAASGHFRAAYRLGHLFAAGAVLVTAAFLIWAFRFLEWFLRTKDYTIFDNMGAAFFYVVIMAGVCVVSFLLCGLAIRLCMRGAESEWRADEEKFTAVVHGRMTTIYYSGVENVLFEKMSFFGRVYGYTVTIKADGARIVFKQMLDSIKKNIPPEASPFYIIKERAGLLRPLVTPAPAPISDSADRFGRPEILPYESAAPVSDTAVTRSDEPSPETDETAVISAGGFFVERKWSGIIMAALVVLFIVGLFDMLSDSGDWSLSAVINAAAFVLLAVVWFFITFTLYNFFKSGKYFRYTANSLEMRISDNKDNVIVLYYRDIKSVSWREFRFFLKRRGVEVRVETKYLTYHWRVVDPNKKESFSVEDTPFYLLKGFITPTGAGGSSQKQSGGWNEL